MRQQYVQQTSHVLNLLPRYWLQVQVTGLPVKLLAVFPCALLIAHSYHLSFLGFYHLQESSEVIIISCFQISTILYEKLHHSLPVL